MKIGNNKKQEIIMKKLVLFVAALTLCAGMAFAQDPVKKPKADTKTEKTQDATKKSCGNCPGHASCNKTAQTKQAEKSCCDKKAEVKNCDKKADAKACDKKCSKHAEGKSAEATRSNK